MATNEIKMGIYLRQNKNTKNSGYGKYYPEVDVQETLSLKGFAKHMSDHGCIYGRDLIEGVLKKITQCLPELVSRACLCDLTRWERSSRRAASTSPWPTSPPWRVPTPTRW